MRSVNLCPSLLTKAWTTKITYHVFNFWIWAQKGIFESNIFKCARTGCLWWHLGIVLPQHQHYPWNHPASCTFVPPIPIELWLYHIHSHIFYKNNTCRMHNFEIPTEKRSSSAFRHAKTRLTSMYLHRDNNPWFMKILTQNFSHHKTTHVRLCCGKTADFYR